MNEKTVSPQNFSRLRDKGGCSGRGGEGENAMYNIFKKFLSNKTITEEVSSLISFVWPRDIGFPRPNNLTY